MPLPVTDINGVTRTMLIKGDVKVGGNWGDQVFDKVTGELIGNAEGLRKWKPSDLSPTKLAA